MPRGQNPLLRAANGTASGRRSPIGLITALALLMATGTVAAQDAANAVFRALEDRLLEAEKLSFSFDIRAVGPVPAVLVGNAVIGPEETARLVADGKIPAVGRCDGGGKEWAARGNEHPKGVTLTFAWPAPVTVAEVVYFGRTSSYDP